MAAKLGGSGLAVVLLLVNLAAGAILPLVDVLSLLRPEPSSVRLAVCCYLTVDILFVILRFGSFRRSHLATADPVSNPLLLLLAALTHLVVPVLGSRGVVLVVIDGVAEIVLLPINLLALLRRQRTLAGKSGTISGGCLRRSPPPCRLSPAGLFSATGEAPIDLDNPNKSVQTRNGVRYTLAFRNAKKEIPDYYDPTLNP
jgi:hypothetical protein